MFYQPLKLTFMKRGLYCVFLVAVLTIASCTKDTDPYALTDAAKASLEKFAGKYELVNMRWDGPDADVDMDGIPDVEFEERQVSFADVQSYARVRNVDRLNKVSFMEFGFPASELNAHNAGTVYTIGRPQMTMWLCSAIFSVDAEGVITVEIKDLDFSGQYLKNFVFEWSGDGFKITADSHLWDYITSSEVKGKTSAIYKKLK